MFIAAPGGLANGLPIKWYKSVTLEAFMFDYRRYDSFKMDTVYPYRLISTSNTQASRMAFTNEKMIPGTIQFSPVSPRSKIAMPANK